MVTDSVCREPSVHLASFLHVEKCPVSESHLLTSHRLLPISILSGAVSIIISSNMQAKRKHQHGTNGMTCGVLQHLLHEVASPKVGSWQVKTTMCNAQQLSQ
jgi:hypothetical protein